MGKRLHGNGLWESSRIVLPEHREALKQRHMEGITVTKKAKRPNLSEFELEELGNKLTEAHEEGRELVLTVWKNGETTIRGRIAKLDASTGMVHVERYGETRKVPFLDILKAERPEW